jgi:transposase
MQQDHALTRPAQLLQSIKGIGAISAAWLLVATHNFTDCQTPKQVAAYAGVVPYKHESGTSIRRREQIGHAGHARLRRALYMATLSATRHNPAIKTFYDRLRAKGKPMKVARCAAARKLIHMAWAVVINQTPYDPDYESHRQIQPPTT